VSNEGGELTWKGMKMRHVVVHDEHEAPMLVTCIRITGTQVVEADAVYLAQVLLRKDAWCSTLGHVWRVGFLALN
jgi:hypothetical protein